MLYGIPGPGLELPPVLMNYDTDIRACTMYDDDDVNICSYRDITDTSRVYGRAYPRSSLSGAIG